MITINHKDPIRKAEQYLDAHVRNEGLVRHAAATRGILSSWGADESVQVAALLIPMIREYVLDEETLIQIFGRPAMYTARLAMKFGIQDRQQPIRRDSVYFLSKLRKLYICAYTDVDTVLLCAADHVALTINMDAFDEVDYQAWAQETLAVNVPLLEMLGIWKERQGMAELALHLHDAGLQAEYEYHVERYYARHSRKFMQINSRLSDVLCRTDLKAVIRMHETTASGVYQRYLRLKRQGKQINLTDPGLLRIDAIVPHERDCYRLLGMLHKLWMPTTSTPIHDYIAAPRYNGYQALISTINVQGQAVQFNIMSHRMADTNARGVLSQRNVKNAWWSDENLPARVAIRHSRPQSDYIHVITPQGELRELKRGSTVVDFAFKVHSQLGPHARRFYVNGKPRPYSHVINHRDLVEVEFDQTQVCLKPEWEHVAQTQTARCQIRRHLAEPKHPNRGRATIDRTLKRESDIYNLRFEDDQITTLLETTARQLRYPTVEDMYNAVTEGMLSPDVLVADIIERELALYIAIPEDVRQKYLPKIRFARSWMQEPGDKKFDRSRRIRLDTEIVGQLALANAPHQNNYIVVHRADSIHAPTLEEGIPLTWRAGGGGREAAHVIVRGSAKPNAIWFIMQRIEAITKDLPHGDKLLYEFSLQMRHGTPDIEFKLDTSTPNIVQNLDVSLNALRKTGIIESYRIWELFPGQHRLVAGLSDRRMRNPYSPKHIKDRNMFFGRGPEMYSIVAAIKSGESFLVLHGEKRIGKTSLMYHLADYVLPQDDSANVIPVLLDALELVPITPEEFVAGLIAAAQPIINRELTRESRRKLKQIQASVTQPGSDPLRLLVEWVKLAERSMRGKRILFMVDEFTAIEEAHESGHVADSFFQRLHHIVDRGEVAFLLCIHNHVLNNLRQKLVDMNLRASFVPITIMDEIDARALARIPLERHFRYEDGVEDAILNLTNRHPFFIHVLCGEIFSLMATKVDDHVTRAYLEEAVGRVMQSGFHRFSHYRDAPGELGLGRETLEIIAGLSGPENDRPAAFADIQSALQHHFQCEPERIEGILKALHQSGAVQRSADETGRWYQIRVRLLHILSRRGTGYFAEPTILPSSTYTY